MKIGNFVIMLLFMLLFCGCGHTMLIESEITGFSVSVPIGESSPINITVGMSKTVTAAVRGGTTVETTSVAGGGIFSGDAGIGKKTTLKTNAQLNEGNLVKIMTSAECTDEAKNMLASNLCAAVRAPIAEPMVIQTQTATVNTGVESVTSNAVSRINRVSGIDKIIDTVPSITTPIIDGAVTAVTATVQAAEGTTVGLFDKFADMCRSIKWTVFFKALCAIASVVGLWLWLNRGSKKTKPLPVIEEVDPALNGAPVVPEHKDRPTDSDTIDVPILNKGDKKTPTKKVGIAATIASVVIAAVKAVFLLSPEARKKLIDWFKNLFKKKSK